MRDRIKEVATKLLIREGYRGFLFRDVADKLDITRANIHYHFGSKERLVEEVVHDYMQQSIAGHEAIWIAPGRTLAQRLADLADFNRARYRKFGARTSRVRAFSLIARMRQDVNLLTPGARQEVTAFAGQIEGWVRSAVEDAVQDGQLREDAPVDDIVALTFALANSAASITDDAGSFDRWEEACMAAARLIERAYGKRDGAA